MAKHYVFEDLEQLADALESLAATLRHLGQSAREDAQHAEIERLLEHLQGSEVDFADVKALGSDSLKELGELLHRLGDLVHHDGERHPT